MNDFTASNGLRVHDAPHGNGWLHVRSGRAEQALHEIGPTELEALREFFQAEADERLGRWRWPENPDYVFYATPNGCRIMQESTGSYFSWNRAWMTDEGIMQNESSAAARAYFDAHPEPKPWHEAQPGEGWVIEIGTEPHSNLQAVVVSNEGKFLFRDGHSLALDRHYIRSGRRFHPEVQS